MPLKAIDKKALLQRIAELDKRKQRRLQERKKFSSKVEKDKEMTPWAYFKPYKWQKKCRDLIARKTIVINMFPNKIGKCLCFQTLIDTPSGKISIGKLYERGEPFNVFAWDGKKKVVAKALTPFKKPGLHECYRIEMNDGQIIEAADHHLVLTSQGWQSVDRLFDNQSLFSHSHQESNSDISPLIHSQDGDHLNQIIPNSQSYYPEYHHFYGEPLLCKSSIGQDAFLTSSDAQQLYGVVFDLGDLEHKYTNIHRSKIGLLSNWYVRDHSLAHFFEFLYSTFYTVFLWLNAKLLKFSRPSIAATSESQSNCEDHSPKNQNSYFSPLAVDGNHIISIKPIGVKECFDFTVPVYHNYTAGGLIHHNTAFWVCIIISWAMGYEAWNEVTESYPGAVKVNDRYYAPSSLGIPPPVKIRITGEDWTSNLGQVVVPEMLKWAPVGQYTTKKNEAGIESIWNWKNDSIFQLMTHKQDPKLFESWMGHGWIPDEPPPKYIWEGMSRGLFLSKGKCLMSITPMSEAWILDDLILSGRRDVGVMDGMTILANDDLRKNEREIIESICPDKDRFEGFWDRYVRLLIFIKKPEKPDRGRKAEKFLYDNIDPKHYDTVAKLKILRFVKDTPEDKFYTRIHGISKSLVGKVYHEYDEDIHICEAFDVPTDWPVAPLIDFHPDTPQAIGFYTVNEQKLKYVIDEHWENINAEEIADVIIRKKISKAWNIRDAWIDALSKGDTNYVKNERGQVQDSFTIIEKKLKKHGIRLHVGSKDPRSGRSLVRQWLKGPNGVATLQFFDTLAEPPEYGHRYEISRWVYGDNGEPLNKNQHFMENLGRFSQTGMKWKPPAIGQSARTNQSAKLGERAWMAS